MDRIDVLAAKLELHPVDEQTRRDPTEDDITTFEQQLGGVLPNDYRQFLMRFGQTAPEHGAVFPILDPCPWGQQGELNMFLGFSTDSGQGIVYETMEVYAGRIPDETIPIAEDSGGNLIILGFDGNATGKVWFWDHEHRELIDRIDELRADVRAKGADVQELEDFMLICDW
jgi:hypothetical protein